jgi:hypothetical protein
MSARTPSVSTVIRLIRPRSSCSYPPPVGPGPPPARSSSISEPSEQLPSIAPWWPHSESLGPGCATTWPAVRRCLALRSSLAGVAFRADGCLPSGGRARSESESASCAMVGWALSIVLIDLPFSHRTHVTFKHSLVQIIRRIYLSRNESTRSNTSRPSPLTFATVSPPHRSGTGPSESALCASLATASGELAQRTGGPGRPGNTGTGRAPMGQVQSWRCRLDSALRRVRRAGAAPCGRASSGTRRERWCCAVVCGAALSQPYDQFKSDECTTSDSRNKFKLLCWPQVR